jgi:SAM-dependent methyltransferase
MFQNTSIQSVDYACPGCKHPLDLGDSTLRCDICNRTYPVIDGIPDFMTNDSYGGVASLARKMDILAPLYEHLFRQKPLLKLAGSDSDSPDDLAGLHIKSMAGVTGAILDVACGTATYTRRIASPGKTVYGIDISMGMLRQGMAYVRRDGTAGVHLARARVEELPFENGVFDGVVCAGSLHLFPDVALALREIARTMKPGAPLTAQTIVVGDTLINRWVRRLREVHTFELAELQRYVEEAGFEGFQPRQDSMILTFSAHKAAAIAVAA